MRLYHFSEDPDIRVFEPRPVRVAVERPPGQEWLNGPLVWAIDEHHDLLYLFPRECPRIVVWPTSETLSEDREKWLGNSGHRAIAFIENAWFERMKIASVHRYHLPASTFEDIDDVGMWVSRSEVIPERVDTLRDLLAELQSRNVELRVMEELTPLKGVWGTSLHASGIRLRNAQQWGKPGWTHSKPGRKVIIT